MIACLSLNSIGMRLVMKKTDGFSLLELLVVVAIILIIATIAIPSMLRSRQAQTSPGRCQSEDIEHR